MVTIKIKYLIFSVLLLMMIVPIGLADLTVSDENQLTIDVDYRDLRDNDNSLTITGTINLKGTDPAQTYSLSTTNVLSGYTLSLDKTTIDVSSSEVTLGYTLKVPVNVDQGISGTVASIKAVDSTNKEKLFNLKTYVKSMLEVNKIRIYVNDNSEKTINEDGDDLKDLSPGDKVELRFQIENRFYSDYDEGDIEGDIEILLEDNDYGDDIDESESFNIDADERFNDEDQEIVFSFTIPKDVDEGKYNLEIKVDSKDGNKARYSTEWVLELDIERENDDLRIENLAVTPSEISCSREATVSAKVANYGNDNQKYGVLTFTNSNLGLDQKFDFSLNSGNNKNNEIVKSQKFTVSDDLKPGIYSIIATTFYDYTTIADKNNVNLVVKECAIAKKSEPKIPNKTVTNEQPTAGTTDTNDKNTESDTKKITSSEIVKTQESTPYTLEDTFIALIIIAIIIITVMITLSIVLLFKK